MKIKEITEQVFRDVVQKLTEANDPNCNGREEWPNFKECANRFLQLVDEFHTGFGRMQENIGNRNGKDLSSMANNLFAVIREANGCIFKEGNYGFPRSALKTVYQKPLTLMYSIKSGMATSLLKFVLSNREAFSKIQSRFRSDEKDRRIMDVIYNGQVEDSYHMPEKLQDIVGLCTSIDSDLVMRDEDSVLPNGEPNPNYDPSKDSTFKSSIREDYMAYVNELRYIVDRFGADTDNYLKKQRIKSAQDGIERGYIIPVFGDESLPCVVKQKVKGKDAYNAIPSAIENTKNDYLLRDKKTNEIVWFNNYKKKGNVISFEDSMPTDGYIAYVYENGKVECDSLLEERIKRIVRKILNEMNYYGI